MGDACGIGPEIIAQAVPRAARRGGCVVLGDVGGDAACRGADRRRGSPVARDRARRPTRWPCRRAACRCCPPTACPPICSTRRSGQVDARAGAAAARVHRARGARWCRRARWPASSPRRSTRRRWPPPACAFPATPRCCRRWPRAGGAAAAGAHDAGQRRAAHGAGDDPPVAAPRDRRGRPSTPCCETLRIAHRAAAALGPGARRASRWPG